MIWIAKQNIYNDHNGIMVLKGDKCIIEKMTNNMEYRVFDFGRKSILCYIPIEDIDEYFKLPFTFGR